MKTSCTSIDRFNLIIESAAQNQPAFCIMKNGAIKAIGTVSELNKEAGANKFEDSFIRFVTAGEIA